MHGQLVDIVLKAKSSKAAGKESADAIFDVRNMTAPGMDYIESIEVIPSNKFESKKSRIKKLIEQSESWMGEPSFEDVMLHKNKKGAYFVVLDYHN